VSDRAALIFGDQPLDDK